MQVRLLIRVVLPQPVFDREAVLALIAYQQRHKRAAYHSHRRRRLHQALLALQSTTPATRLQGTLAPPRAITSQLAAMRSSQQAGDGLSL
jgi:hypothetical protein